MFLVLCASVVLVWANAWHDVRRRSAWAVTSMVLAATTAAWVFDTYLLKNFAVSTWWWLIAGCVLASRGCDGERVGPVAASLESPGTVESCPGESGSGHSE